MSSVYKDYELYMQCKFHFKESTKYIVTICLCAFYVLQKVIYYCADYSIRIADNSLQKVNYTNSKNWVN